MKEEMTSVQLSKRLVREIASRGTKGETYESILQRIMKEEK